MVLKLSVARVDVLVWVLIYGGLLTLAVGLALRHVDGALAGGVSLIGSIAAAVGAFLIWIRARMVRSAAVRAPGSSTNLS